MLHHILSSLLSHTSNDAVATRRRHPRRETDRCICTMYGQTFPLFDWSFGGARIVADERMFGMSQDVHMVLKFKLRNTILDIRVSGTVIRKDPGSVGIQFEPLTQTIRRYFQQVIDDQVAYEFADSQA